MYKVILRHLVLLLIKSGCPTYSTASGSVYQKNILISTRILLPMDIFVEQKSHFKKLTANSAL